MGKVMQIKSKWYKQKKWGRLSERRVMVWCGQRERENVNKRLTAMGFTISFKLQTTITVIWRSEIQSLKNRPVSTTLSKTRITNRKLLVYAQMFTPMLPWCCLVTSLACFQGAVWPMKSIAILTVKCILHTYCHKNLIFQKYFLCTCNPLQTSHQLS